MRTPHRQRGLGWFGLLFVFGTIAFVAIVTIKCLPLYANQMNIARAVRGVAEDPALGGADPMTVRDHLQRRWDVDYISQLQARDIKIKRTERGRELSYDYEARAKLFYNISIVIHFKDDVPMRNTSGGG